MGNRWGGAGISWRIWLVVGLEAAFGALSGGGVSVRVGIDTNSATVCPTRKGRNFGFYGRFPSKQFLTGSALQTLPIAVLTLPFRIW